MLREFSRFGLALVLIAGLIVRIGYVACLWPSIAPDEKIKDPDDYGRLALNLVHTGTFGYPIISPGKATSSAIEEPVPPTDSGEPKSPGESDNPQKSGSAENAQNAEHSPQNIEKTEGAEDTGSSDGSSNADGSSDPVATPLKQSMRPTAFRPPLYPSMLVPAVIPDIVKGKPLSQVELNPFVVVGLHILLGLATIGMVYYIAWRLDYRWQWFPALAVAADPILLHYSGEMMTETLITFLAVWAWAVYLILVRPDSSESGRKVWGIRISLRASMLLGFILGLAVLTRPTMLPWAMLMVLSLGIRGSETGNRVAMITAALIVITIVNAAWMVRNKQQLGQPIWTTTHGGYTLLLANNPPLYKHFNKVGPNRNWDAESFHKLWALRREGDPRQPEFWRTPVPTEPVIAPDIREIKDDRLAQEVAIATIKSDPKTFGLSCMYRAGWLWSLYPNVQDDQVKGVQSSIEKLAVPQAESADGTPVLGRSEQLKWIVGSWYGVWFAMAVLGALWLREALTSRVWLMPILLLLTLTAIHSIYWSNMRMRAPMMPVVYMIACWPLIRARTPTRL